MLCRVKQAEQAERRAADGSHAVCAVVLHVVPRRVLQQSLASSVLADSAVRPADLLTQHSDPQRGERLADPQRAVPSGSPLQ